MRTVLVNGRIINGAGGVIEKGEIEIEGKVLSYVGPVRNAPSHGSGTCHDLSGMTVLPGLIDCHVHLCFDGSPDPLAVLQHESVATTALKAAEHARRTLEAGITTVRDLGGKDYAEFAVRDAVEAGWLHGPRMLCCGRPVCMTGGTAWPVGREADGPDEVRKAVREQLKAGADVIKLMATGGVLTRGTEPGASQLTPEELAAAVDEARKAGRRAASHAQGAQGIRAALDAGVDSIEHGIFLDDEAIADMATRGVCLVATLSAPHHILEQGLRGGLPAFVVEKTRTVAESHFRNVGRAFRGGVPVAMGTDAGTPFNFHGRNLAELELLHKAGLPAMEVLRGATDTASRLLGLYRRVGTLEQSKLADLVITRGNPLDKIGLLKDGENILAVIKEGRVFKGPIPGL